MLPNLVLRKTRGKVTVDAVPRTTHSTSFPLDYQAFLIRRRITTSCCCVGSWMQTIVSLSLGDNDAENDFLKKLWPIAVKYIGHVVWGEAMTGNTSCLVACCILIDHVGTKIHLRQARLPQRRIDCGDIDVNELHAGTWH